MRRFQFLKKADFFSQPFRFFVEENSLQRQTIFGGVLSVLTVLISLGYLTYLLYLYFDNDLLPTISSQMHNQTTEVSQTFNKSLFGFTFNSQNLTMDQLYQQTGKVFLTFQLQQLTFAYNTIQTVNLNYVNCDNDPNFVGFKCIDYDSIPDSAKEIFSNPTNLSQSLFSLTVAPCSGLPNCADNQLIQNYIMQNSFQFLIKIRVSQFNEEEKQMEETFLLDYIQFDDNLSFQNQYVLQLQKTTIKTGYIFQDSNTTIDVASQRRLITYYSQDNLLTKAGFVGYAQFQFFLDQMQVITKIQYPLITEVFAQFLPILNILLAIGFIGRLFAESKMVKDINNIYLKEYYKNTAIKIIQNQNKEIFLKSKQGSYTEQIKYLHQNINDIKQFRQKKEKTKLNFKQKLQSVVYSIFKKKEEDLKNQQQANLFKLIQSKTVENINIYQLYRDIIELKMAIRLLMSPEQYAAMQFCGCEINLKSQPMQIVQNKQEELQVKEEIINVQQKNMSPLSQNQDLEEQIISISECKENTAQVIKTNKQVHLIFNRDKTKSNDEEQFKEEDDIFSHKQLNQIQKHDQVQQTSLHKITTLSYNHLQVIEDMLNNKDNIFSLLQSFIEKINNSKQQLSQTDLNIYSSLIGLDQNMKILSTQEIKYNSSL
ncbi:transmembrane protein, putative (macronuclear) [Tetrahymena thermophila SB210]|uniref:Transmembrane protein, putative n=1 Tax=Tetrahymena thermophila (strain SB210) TaxID=312017 RepID=I7M785_TETTS|nr:transmembrane protein, putative [Tetrahymena thermophila SB210]EAR90754.1 transmembrane protein, putative [Tetrahymena thermophila SB210]|eukprot:XP_001010999.1 transmembrane protein, putative [Tetrahymena thermophila SB210]